MMAQRLQCHFSSASSPLSPTPTPFVWRNSSRRTRLVCKAFLENDNGNGLLGTDRHLGLPLSMFTPYRQLPPEGEVVPAADAACDPSVQKCKTPIYTYESRCRSCSGTGFVKSHANGRRASLCTCLLCHGLGFVRRTTARFVPDPDSPEGMFTLARPPPSPGRKMANATTATKAVKAESEGDVKAEGRAEGKGSGQAGRGSQPARGTSGGGGSSGGRMAAGAAGVLGA